MRDRNARALSLHPIEGFLKELEIAGLAQLLAGGIDPLLFERVLSWTIVLVENTEDAGEG